MLYFIFYIMYYISLLNKIDISQRDYISTYIYRGLHIMHIYIYKSIFYNKIELLQTKGIMHIYIYIYIYQSIFYNKIELLQSKGIMSR